MQLNYKKTKQYVVCYDLATMGIIMGSTSVAGNKHLYGIKKIGNAWRIPIAQIKKRIKSLEFKAQQYKERAEIMRKILKR